MYTPPISRSTWLVAAPISPLTSHSYLPEPITRVCPFQLRHTPAVSAIIQDVGFVCLLHVCASEPRLAAAQERGSRRPMPGHGESSPDTVVGEAGVGRTERDGRAGPGYPPGEAPAAEPGRRGPSEKPLCRGITTARQGCTFTDFRQKFIVDLTKMAEHIVTVESEGYQIHECFNGSSISLNYSTHFSEQPEHSQYLYMIYIL